MFKIKDLTDFFLPDGELYLTYNSTGKGSQEMPKTPYTMAEALMLEMQKRIRAELKAWRLNPEKGPADWYNLAQQMSQMTTDTATFTQWAITEGNIQAAELNEDD